MKETLHKAILIITIALGWTTYSGRVPAQTVDQCMTASPADSLTICKSLLDNGSRNADVYYKLSSAQHQTGKYALSEQTLIAALKLHPGNDKLITFKKFISSATTEQQRIELSAQLNQRSLDQGELKISCLTKSGEEAISACKRRLELTDVDGDRMRRRLAELGEFQAPVVDTDRSDIVISPERLDAEEKAKAQALGRGKSGSRGTGRGKSGSRGTGRGKSESRGTGRGKSESRGTGRGKERKPRHWQRKEREAKALAEERAKAEAAQKARRVLVSDVQARLNEFGFDAGFVDGVQGSQSSSALTKFYAAIGTSGSTSITNLTLDDLRDEKRKLTSAEDLLQQSELALQQGNAQLATQKLEDAKQTSKLLKIPDELQIALRPVTDPILPDSPNEDPEPTSPLPKPIPDPQQNPPSRPPEINSEQFSELMDGTPTTQSLHEVAASFKENSENPEVAGVEPDSVDGMSVCYSGPLHRATR